jgi:hypothetical protein
MNVMWHREGYSGVMMTYEAFVGPVLHSGLVVEGDGGTCV